MKSKTFPNLYHLLSFDVLAGVLAGEVMAAKIFSIIPPLVYWIILPATVWWIYLTDHILDGLKLKEKTNNPRHLFFYEKRKVLILLSISLGILDAVLISLFIPKSILLRGLILGGIVLIYLFLSHLVKTRYYLFFPKEFITALIFTCGIWSIPLLLTPGETKWFQMILIAGYFMITASNLLIYSIFELSSDQGDRQVSLARTFGKERALQIILWWCFFSFLFNGASLLLFVPGSKEFIACGILILIQVLQIIILLKSDWFESRDRYRWFNEGLFLLPFLLLLF